MKYKKRLQRSIPAALLVVLILAFSVAPVAAASGGVLDPMEMGATVSPADDGYMLALDPDPELTYWERYLNDELRLTAVGGTYTGNSQERLIDNLLFRVYPFGQLKWMSCNGLTIDTSWHFDFSFKFQRNSTISQDFGLILQAFLVICDSSGNEIQVYPGHSWSQTYETTDATRVNYPWEDNFDIDRNAASWDSSDYFYIYYNVSFFGIEDEDISTSVNFTLYSDVGMTLPVNSVYGDYIQSGQTNAYLDTINQTLEENGQTMQDVLQEQQQTNDKLDGIQDSMDQTNDKLDDLISGGQAGQDIYRGDDALDNAGDNLQDSMDQVQDFEDQYISEFQDNLDEILADFSIDLLAEPLNFIQGYLNRIIASVPPAYMVVFTLPMLLGLLLYILGHPVRVPSPAAARSGGSGDIPDETIKLKNGD